MKTQEHLPALQMDESELLAVLESSLYPGASPASIKMVLGYCKASGLDPMRKPVHIVPMWDAKASRMRDVVMPGIGLYRTDAARTGQYAGITEPDFGPDVTQTIGGVSITFPLWCRVTVSRSMPDGSVRDFTAREFWLENYAAKGGKEKSIAPNAMWQKRPYGQIAKCAEAQALRKAFPEVGSQPTSDEMDGRVIDMGDAEEVTPQPQPPARPALPDYAAEAFERNLPSWSAIVASGKKTAGELLTMLSTKARFSEEQRARILSLKPAPPTPEPAVPASNAGDEIADFVAEMNAAEGKY